MKIGIIIICYNNENDIDIGQCAKYLNELKDIEICLVNNDSKDNTYNLLEELKEHCVNVSILDIKRFKSDNSAVRAGARFMSNQFSLKYLGYVNSNSLFKYHSIVLLFKAIRDNQVDILNYNQSFLNKKGIRLTMFQSLFPVMDYLEKMNIENLYTSLNHNQ
ncbi:glycosyltransferase [Hyunsoonleella aestuarii]|uniref:Glycosyltransferase 2-like domain-containing protein n=1 Tax=Hyunsoonleella aestuarii TaxID=912802 RepID=A0ABP8EDC0_9FLAO|nr:glycosyltransferase [Hyunsoonleella aestuarii]